MSTPEIILEASRPFTDCENQALVITVPNDYKETFSSQSSLSDLSQNTTPFIEVKNSLHVSNESLKETDFQKKTSSCVPSTVKSDSEPPQKKC